MAESPLACKRLAVVVMGVCGAGKTTVAKRLAKRLGAEFLDGDDLHTDEARAKMRSGKPLGDPDRWPWLDRIGAALAVGVHADSGTIVACSALKRVYRDRLRAAAGPALTFVYLDAEPDVMRRRVGGRSGHHMPASLVDSQFAALEPPLDEPDVIAVSAQADLETTLAALATRVGAASSFARD